MKSSQVVCRLLSVASIILACAVTVSSVHASSAPVILDLEGNPTCSSLVENSIFEARENSPSVGETETLNTLTLRNGQELTYTINPDDGATLGDTVTKWIFEPGEISPPIYPINFVILKGEGNAGARVFHYGKQGVKEDGNLKGPGTLKTVTFCYGLDGEGSVVGDTVPDCSKKDFKLEGVTIDCSLTDGEGVSFHAIKKGDTLTYSECTCNEIATVCDKSLPVGEIGACIAKCPPSVDDETGESNYPYTFNDVEYDLELTCLQDNALKETPVGGIEPWNNGSGWCSSFSGSGSCKRW